MTLLLVLIAFALAVLLVSVVGVGVTRRRARRPPAVEPPRPPPPPRPAPPPPTPAPPAPPVPTEPAIAVEGAPVVEAPPPEAAPAVRPRFRDRLGKARGLLAGYVGSVLSRSGIDDQTWEELEEALVRADVGVATTTSLLSDLRRRASTEGISTPDALVEALKAELVASLAVPDRVLAFEPGAPNVWLFVGVNGVGKTTTIGKLGRQQSELGRTVIMAAGDTFRAAAAEQLELWAGRVGAPVVRGAEGGDPGAVVFDAVERAAARHIDLVLADTAGRLHTKVNLMEELAKVRRVAGRGVGRVTEVLLVIDATTGQNGLAQARQFTEAVEVTGIVLTKLDGTAKGGIAVAIQTELGIPVKLVGLGESAEDLVAFDPEEFVEALFS
ncbi:MAG: signal recognition particle-docking protein FtsY [Acidimicrobiales bacterium]